MTLTLRRILSKWYHNLSFLLSGISYYYNDMMYFRKQSNLGAKNNSEERMRSSLTASYHIIEKGLSMPNRRLGFGQERLTSLIKECERYYKLYGEHKQLDYAISIVKEYDELHKRENYKLENNIQCMIDEILLCFPKVKSATQLVFTKKEYFAHAKESFDTFSTSRHSMRHFGGSVSLGTIEKVIELAKNAPSACNKQPVRVHILSDKKIVAQVLEMQQGNRGFGQDIDKVLIITTQFTGCTRYSERYMPFMDSGIFVMNLLYALHFYEVGAIPLVWLNSPQRDNLLRELVGIPEFEMPVIILGVGDVTDDIVCALSPRLNTMDLLIEK